MERRHFLEIAAQKSSLGLVTHHTTHRCAVRLEPIVHAIFDVYPQHFTVYTYRRLMPCEDAVPLARRSFL